MELKAGDRLHSAVSETEVIVIRASAGDVALTCGGVLLARAGEDGSGGQIQPGQEGDVLLGKRYVDDGDTLELLCTKPPGHSVGVELPMRTRSVLTRRPRSGRFNLAKIVSASNRSW